MTKGITHEEALFELVFTLARCRSTNAEDEKRVELASAICQVVSMSAEDRERVYSYCVGIVRDHGYPIQEREPGKVRPPERG